MSMLNIDIQIDKVNNQYMENRTTNRYIDTVVDSNLEQLCDKQQIDSVLYSGQIFTKRHQSDSL